MQLRDSQRSRERTSQRRTRQRRHARVDVAAPLEATAEARAAAAAVSPVSAAETRDNRRNALTLGVYAMCSRVAEPPAGERHAEAAQRGVPEEERLRSRMLEECSALRQSLSTDFFLQCAARVAASGMTLGRADAGAEARSSPAEDARARDVALAAHSLVLSSISALQASLASETSRDVASAVECAGEAGRELAHFVVQRVGQQQLLRRRYESRTGVPWRGSTAVVAPATGQGATGNVPTSEAGGTHAQPRTVASLPRSVASIVDVGWSLHGDIPARSAVRAISTVPGPRSAAGRGAAAEDGRRATHTFHVMPGVEVL